MSDAFGASVHQPDPGMLQRVIEYLRGRTAAASPDLSAKDQLQQALAAQQVYGGPQGRPFADVPAAAPVSAAFNAAPTQPVQTQPLPPPSAPPSQPAPPPPAAPAQPPPDVPPAVVAYAGGGATPGYGTGDYPQSAGGYAPKPPMPTAWPATSTPTGMPSAPQGTPSATPSAAGAGRDVTVNKKSPWGPQSAPNQDVIGARGGPLSDRKMGMFDLSSLFGGGNGNG